MKETLVKLASRARFALLAGALIVAGSSFALNRLVHANDETKSGPVRLEVNETPVNRDLKLTTSFSPVVKKIAPSVVKIFTTTKLKPPGRSLPWQFDDPLFRWFFGNPFDGDRPGGRFRTPKQYGLGSGVVVTKDGYILTNNHVVDGADEIRVALSPGRREYTAKIVGKDPKTEIAILKIDAKDLPVATLGNSDTIEVGDLVLAVGNPFGIGQTVTMGMISAKSRGDVGIGDYEDFIQTDAAINPGNSGGALVDAEGRVIGINTSILSRSGGNEGIGFAVPINLARHVMEQLIDNGRVVRGFLGVRIQDLTPGLAQEFNLDEPTGALVGEVTPKSPAEKAGLQSGDVIIKFNSKKVSDSRNLKLQVASTPPDTKVQIDALRDGKIRTFDVTLKELPEDESGTTPALSSEDTGDTLDGVTVTEIDPRARRLLGLPPNLRGALVSEIDPDSAAYEAGLRQGDVIIEINRKPVLSADDAVALTERLKDKTILLRVWSHGGSHYLVVDESK